MATVSQRLRTVIATVATSALLASAAVLSSGSAAMAADPLPSPPPLLQRDSSVVTSDPLPTVQIDNGYVWAQATIGTTVYAVGQFANARAAMAMPGTSLTPRNNILAFDINTGALLSFAPEVNGVIKAVAASPDGQRIYIGGSFSSVNGQTRWNFAALDAKTGALIPGFAPSIGGSGVYALAASGDGVYVGGLFTQANGTPRQNFAAFSAANGALRTDTNVEPDQQVDAMVIDPGGQKVILGGRFGQVNGDGTWRGLAAVDIATGQLDTSWAGTAKVKNGVSSGSYKGKAGIFALAADSTAVYGTGWVYANAASGNLEGVFALESSSGQTRWLADCLGDHYGVYSTGSVVYSTTHTHACGTMNLWPEQSPRTHRFIHAMTTDVRGTLGYQPHTGSTYANWQGEAAPSAYAWYPDFAVGTTSGLGQAGLSITGVGNTIAVAGEFRAVNNRQFEGIVRFSSTPPGGAKDGPRTTTTTWGAPTAQTSVPGRIRVAITGTFDRDDRDLTYELLREGNSGVIDSVTKSNGWWNLPQVGLQDTTVTPGSTYTYRIRVKDGDGNAVTSQPVTATATSGDPAEYTNTVLDDGASLYYPLGSSAEDWAGSNAPTFGSGVSAGSPSGVVESPTGYSQFSGNSDGRVSSTRTVPVNSEFSAELWFRTTTNRGGKLIGYGDASSGTSGSYDRHVYMRNDGRLVFGVYPNSVKTVTSSQSYRDGNWHHVVASQSAAGMKLYVDGVLVGSDSSVTTAQGYSGYWRVGGDNLSGWPDRPTSDWFNGQIDEVAVYSDALTPAQVSTHYAVGTGLTAPTASFTTTANDLDVAFDASGSTVSAGGSVSTYSWNFGDGSPVATTSSATTSHAFPATGTYTVKLTVTDSHGLIGTTEKTVSVLGPNLLPTASFTAAESGLTVTADASASADSDGSIASYSWNWGDSSPATTGSVASHRYTQPGTYTVTLTVTDNRGGTATSTREVTATHAAPVAAFELSKDALSVNVDASATTASDEATLEYSWNWGDSSAAGSGAQASHTYSESGTYDVTLTATDSIGASTTVTKSVTVTATSYAALDEFERVVSNGWGAAPTGGVWSTMFGSSSVASVSGSTGVLALAPGSTRAMALEGLSLRDSETTIDYTTAFGPATGTGYIGAMLRQSGTDGYIIHAWHRNNGTVWLVIQRGGTVIATQTISGMTWGAGDSFTLKAEASGISPTTLRAKIWKSGTAEPSSWQLTTTDSTAAYQRSGFTSVRYSLGGVSQSAGTVSFDRFAARDLVVPAPNEAPVARFSSSVDGLKATVDGSASTDADGSISTYEWTWGDSSAKTTGSDATVSHTYASAGTYTVTLKVTDDDGASHEVSHDVTVTAPSVPFLAKDEFTRTATSSWGTADVGGTWAISGGAVSAASVADGKARLNLAAGSTRIATLSNSALRNYTAKVDFSANVGSDSGAVYAGFVTRTVGSDSYIVHAWLRPNGTVWLVAQRGGTTLQTATVQGVTYAAGDTFTLKVEVTGTSSTQMRAKLWAVGAEEPTNWQLTATDDTAALQASGTIGLRTNRTTASTSSAVVTYDNFEVVAVD